MASHTRSSRLERGFSSGGGCWLPFPSRISTVHDAAGLIQRARIGWCESRELVARLRGCTATQRSKKGSEKVLGRVLGRTQLARGFTVKRGSEKGSRRGF